MKKSSKCTTKKLPKKTKTAEGKASPFGKSSRKTPVKGAGKGGYDSDMG